MTLKKRFSVLLATLMLASSLFMVSPAWAVPSTGPATPTNPGWWCATVVTSAPGESYSGRTSCGHDTQADCLAALSELIDKTINFWNEPVYDSYCTQSKWARF